MNKKSWFSLIIAMVVICTCIVGCGNKPKTDEAFIKNLSAGLQERWKIADKEDSTEKDNATTRDYLSGLVDKELNKLGDYSDYQFTDSALGDLAKQYFDALAMQKEGISKYGIADDEYNELFNGGYNTRAKLISIFYDKYGLTVKKEFNDSFEKIIQIGYAVIKEDEKFEAIQNMIGDTVVLTAKGGTDYELSYTNTTEYDLKDVQLLFKFFNEEGTEVGNEEEYETVSAGAQSTKKISLYDVPEFASAKMAIEYRVEGDYSTKKETEYKDISVVNNMKVTLTAKNLPAEVSSTSSYSGILTTAQITAVSTKEAYWDDGKCTLSITVSGKKTYDREGDQSSDSCRFMYKVFDASGNVVGSGTIYASSVMVGDNFTEDGYVNDLDPGEYTIEFFDESY